MELYQQLRSEVSLPEDVRQLPDIFVSILVDDKRVSYSRIKSQPLVDAFKASGGDAPKPTWCKLERDVFGACQDDEAPGTVLMSIGFGRLADRHAAPPEPALEAGNGGAGGVTRTLDVVQIDASNLESHSEGADKVFGWITNRQLSPMVRVQVVRTDARCDEPIVAEQDTDTRKDCGPNGTCTASWDKNKEFTVQGSGFKNDRMILKIPPHNITDFRKSFSKPSYKIKITVYDSDTNSEKPREIGTRVFPLDPILNANDSTRVV